jgi:hypothetical protein
MDCVISLLQEWAGRAPAARTPEGAACKEPFTVQPSHLAPSPVGSNAA